MMTFEDLRVFCTVAAERSFSRAARKLRRTQPAVSQAIRRLEEAAGERLIDRSSRDGTLTDAGTLLLEYGTRLLHLADEATMAVGALREVRQGRVLIGANDGGVYSVLPLVAAFQKHHPAVVVDVRRIAARQMAQEVLLRAVDFGVLTFNPAGARSAVDGDRHRRAGAPRRPGSSARQAVDGDDCRRSGARRSSRTTTPRPPATACCARTSSATHP